MEIRRLRGKKMGKASWGRGPLRMSNSDQVNGQNGR